MSFLTAHRRLLLVALGVVVLVLAAVPVTAFVVIPQFVRSTAHEAAPGDHMVKHDASPAPGASPSDHAMAEVSKTLASGDLRQINVNDFGRGKVLLLQVGTKHFIRFDNVEISAAPAQHVYLSDRTDGKPGNYTDVGVLKATNGSFNYEIPASLDLSTVKSVVSYCQQFNVTITYAVLKSA